MAFGPPRHALAASCLVTNDGGEILMIRSPRRGWEIPGGIVEPGESVIEGAKRETLEETGATVEVGQLAGVYTNLSSGIIGMAFLARYVEGELRTSLESLDVEWVPRESATRRVTAPIVRHRIEDLLSFDGQVIYRAYNHDPYAVVTEQRI